MKNGHQYLILHLSCAGSLRHTSFLNIADKLRISIINTERRLKRIIGYFLQKQFQLLFETSENE